MATKHQSVAVLHWSVIAPRIDSSSELANRKSNTGFKEDGRTVVQQMIEYRYQIVM
jgi:hypothetical protein